MDSERGPLPLYRTDGTLPASSAIDGRAHHPNAISPYMLTMSELIRAFGTTRARLDLLEGFLRLRAGLRVHGFTGGFHWIGGSFVRARGNPHDIDVASFVLGPVEWTDSLCSLHPEVFGKERVKELHGCDARFVDLRTPAIIRWVLYWSQVYSTSKPIEGEDRETAGDRRLGFVEVPIATRDEDFTAQATLAETRRTLDSSFLVATGAR